MSKRGLPGLSAQLKDRLIQQALERRLKQAAENPMNRLKLEDEIPDRFHKFNLYPNYQQLQIINEGASRLGLNNPFFKLHEGVAGGNTIIDGKQYINFASYNYLGFSGHPEVCAAAKAAIDQYGTSVSASRIVSGERPIHRQLELEIARLFGTQDAVTFVSGHATNVTVIGHLFGPNDLVIHDELIHNSVLQGVQLSGAKRLSFRHNDYQDLDALLSSHRRQYERVLVVIEGIYSMDGDFPDLPRFIEVKTRHKVFLMIDEAHSLGVMGENGLGIREHFGLAGSDVDIWMGTLSKAMAGCGGYIAGERGLIEHLKFLAPGFLYSVGMPPPVAAAALESLKCLQREPERVARLKSRGTRFYNLAKSASINVGQSIGLAVVPCIVGSSVKATRLASALFETGINVQPIIYPAVPENSARLRFFISCEHTEGDIDRAVKGLAHALTRV